MADVGVDLSPVARGRIEHINRLRRAGFSFGAIAGHLGVPEAAVAKLVGVELYRHGDLVTMSYKAAIEALEATQPTARAARRRDWLMVSDMEPELPQMPSDYWRRLLRAAEHVSGLPKSALLGETRKQEVARARRALYVVALGDGHSASAIGRKLQRDHSTVLGMAKKQAAAPDPAVSKLTAAIRTRMELLA